MRRALWDAHVVTVQGRTVTVRKIPWIRTREMTVHTIDLDKGGDPR